MESSLPNIRSEVKCFIADILIQCTRDAEPEGHIPPLMSFTVHSARENTEEALFIERSSPRDWIHNSILELTTEATLSVTWEGANNCGRANLKKTDLDGLKAGSGSHTHITREFVNDADGPLWTLNFKVYTIPLDKNVEEQENNDWPYQDLHTLMEKEPEKIFTIVKGFSDDVTTKSRCLNLCGCYFLQRFRATGHELDIDNCVLAYGLAMKLTREGDIKFMAFVEDAGMAFQERYDMKGNLSDINQAISHFQIVVNGASNNNGNLPAWLNNLGTALQRRFHHLRDLTDISEAITHQRKAVHLTPDSHADMPRQLYNLAFSLQCRFERVGDPADIAEAITYLRKAVHLTPDNYPYMPILLSNLGILLQRRFEQVGDLGDISEAITCQQKAVRLIPDSHTDMPLQLGKLGNLLQHRFERAGDLTDISEAITYLQKAVHLIPDDHAYKPILQGKLGNLFQQRFGRAGKLTDISEAITHQRKALLLTPESNVYTPLRLNNLGFLLQERFERVGDVTDISEAVTHLQKAVHLTPDGHADMPLRLDNLGISLRHRFKGVGDLADISEAIKCHQKAIHLTPDRHADMPLRLNNLAVSLHHRFEEVGDFSDISEAIKFQQEAVYLTPEGHAYMPLRLNNLGLSLQRRFKQEGDITDILEAIKYQQKAVHLTPNGHADMPTWLNSLGLSLQRRFEHSADPSDNQSATLHFWQAATYSSGPSSRRLAAAMAWIQYSQDPSPLQLLEAHKIVINLVSEVAGLEQTIQKRHNNLVDISNLSSSAAAAAIKLDRCELALEWLEQGRCLVWTQLNDLRAPVDALRDHNPALAESIWRVSRALETAGYREELSAVIPEVSMLKKISQEEEVGTHLKLAQEWDQLLSVIRAIPGFEDFLQPLSYNTLLKNLPESGTVVVINVHKDRSDALALTSGGKDVLHIPLPSFSYTKADHLHSKLTAHLRSSGVRMRESDPEGRGMRLESDGKGGNVMNYILTELWDLVVKPILESLGYTEPSSELSRIWWCATGPLAFLPIHAAGIYDEPTATIGKASTLADFAISSYTPTVRALVDRVKAPRIIEENKTGVFMISQPNTPNMSSIPGTTAEVQVIEDLLKKQDIRTLCLEGEAATIDEGIKNMENHTCIHFACHARQETDEPLKSGFALHDGRLELSKIIKQQLSAADLAFLSACQTSTGDEKLSEEAVHLAAGMLAAGYRSVIATMWSIDDRHAPKIAKDFYENLIGMEEKKMNSNNAARALRHSTQNLRRSLGDSELSLLTWVPYVHFGL